MMFVYFYFVKAKYFLVLLIDKETRSYSEVATRISKNRQKRLEKVAACI